MVIICEVKSTEDDSSCASSESSTSLKPDQLAELKNKEANDFYSAKKYKKDLTIYNEIIFWCPNIAKYYSNRCACFMMLSKYDDAIKNAKKCLELDPKFLKASIRLVKCCLILGYVKETENAIKKLEKLELTKESVMTEILELDKGNPDAIYIKGTCCYYEDNVENAFKDFDRVLQTQPDHEKTKDIYELAKLLQTKKEDGNTAFKAQQHQQAYDIYTEALKIDPKCSKINAKLHFNKATVAAKLKKLKESISECNEALKLDKNYLKAILRKAACYMELEEFEQAVRDYEKACKLDTTNDRHADATEDEKKLLEKNSKKLEKLTTF